MTLATLIYYPPADAFFHLGSNLDLNLSHQEGNLIFLGSTQVQINDGVVPDDFLILDFELTFSRNCLSQPETALWYLMLEQLSLYCLTYIQSDTVQNNQQGITGDSFLGTRTNLFNKFPEIYSIRSRNWESSSNLTELAMIRGRTTLYTLTKLIYHQYNPNNLPSYRPQNALVTVSLPTPGNSTDQSSYRCEFNNSKIFPDITHLETW